MHARPYADCFHRRLDPRGRTYFWLGVDPVTATHAGQRRRRATDHFLTDIEAVEQGYVSVTPLSVDRTNYRLLSKLCGRNGEVETPARPAR
jgi:5'-nucleotidase